MTETMKSNTTYTEMDIARTLAHMGDKKMDILCSNLKMNELKALANDDKSFEDYLTSVEKYGKAYMLYAEILKEFHEKLSDPQTISQWIADVNRTYRGLSTQDKVKFNREIAANSNLETSLEILKDSWGKLTGDITGGK